MDCSFSLKFSFSEKDTSNNSNKNIKFQKFYFLSEKVCILEMRDMNQMQVLQEKAAPIQLSTLFVWADKINPKDIVFVVLSVTIIPSHSSQRALVQHLQELGFRRSSRNTSPEVLGIFQAATQTPTTLKFQRDMVKSRMLPWEVVTIR